MSRFPEVDLDDQWILSHRSGKNALDLHKPYAFLTEKERSATGSIDDVATIFLTNRECPFRCLMCDLWKNTIDAPSVPGMIPEQISYALERMPAAKHIKLYNSGNFFDTKAIPRADYQDIASRLDGFETVIVECHPKLITSRVLEFRDMLQGSLEIAIGLETAHPEVLQNLNKRMTLEEFSDSVRFLGENDIDTRAFTLLRPPFLSEEEGLFWAKRTLDFAFDAGVGCCVVIPTRTGNGAMEWLQAEGYFSQPLLASLENTIEYGLSLRRGRVFGDLWDLERFSNCRYCFEQRRNRLHAMNLKQSVLPEIVCPHCS